MAWRVPSSSAGRSAFLSQAAANVTVIAPILAGFFGSAAVGWSLGRSATRKALDVLRLRNQPRTSPAVSAS